MRWPRHFEYTPYARRINVRKKIGDRQTDTIPLLYNFWLDVANI